MALSATPRNATPAANGFLYKEIKCSLTADQLAELKPHFDRLPPDPYVERPFRRRRLSCVHGEPGELFLQDTVFKQGSENKLFNSVVRVFEPLEADLGSLPAFREIVRSFREAGGLDNSTLIDVHAIRIVATPGEPGDPAPEGIHRDGRELVGIFCVDRCRVSGAVTALHSRPGGDPAGEELFCRILHPGEAVLVNDRAAPEGCFHYTGPISASEPPLSGSRDVFVLTYPTSEL